ncbi:MAG: autotransporter outer membrane beta-barrel domain-containing protein [Verrucomicrobiota bacterium]
MSQSQSFDSFGGNFNGAIFGNFDGFWETFNYPSSSGNSDRTRLVTGLIGSNGSWAPSANRDGAGFAISDAVVTTTGTYSLSYVFPALFGNTISATPYVGVGTSLPDVDGISGLTLGDLRALGAPPTTLTLNAGDNLILGYEVSAASGATNTNGALWMGNGLITITLVVDNQPVHVMVDPNEVLAKMSANMTGTFVPNAQSSAQIDINNTALNALHNQRVVRARSRMSNPRAEHDTLAQSDRHLTRYLQFAGGEGLTTRQALGLEDVPASFYQPENKKGVASTLEKVFSIEQAAGDTLVAEEPDRWEIYTVADFGTFDQGALNTVNRGYDSNTWAASVGVEYMVSPMLNIGTAFTYADNDTDLNEGLGNVDIEGQLYSVYATMFKNAAYLDVMYSYGDFENRLVRNTLVAGNALGTPDSDSHTFSVNAGKNFEVNGLVTGPTLGFDYSEGTTDAYNETGGGIANLNYQERQFESAISSLGWHVSKTKEVNAGILTLQAFTSWDHEFSPDDGPIRATLANFGAVNLNQPGAGPGTDWMTLGAAANLATASGWDFMVDYQTQLFREDVEAHYVGVKASTTF